MPTRQPPKTEEGLFVSHLMLRITNESRANPEELQTKATDAVDLLSTVSEEHKFDLVRVVSGEADFMTVLFTESLEAIETFQRQLLSSSIGAELERVDTFLSVTELSMYESLEERVESSLRKEGISPNDDNYDEAYKEREKRLKKYQQMRLDPDIPEMSYVTFYPMSKRRAPEQNWYQLPQEERAEMMSSHGKIGRQYAGKVQQIITSCVGLDDWEWGVTLYSDDLKQFKRLIYEMRFDEVSAEYSDFGPFYTGFSIDPDEFPEYLSS
ncbi:MAG: chlorite dismutase family protein [bacterium]